MREALRRSSTAGLPQPQPGSQPPQMQMQGICSDCGRPGLGEPDLDDGRFYCMGCWQQLEAMHRAHQGAPAGMPGGMGGMQEMMAKMMSNPKAMALMQKAQANPKIMQALQDVQTNGPSAMSKYANDPEIMEIIKELQSIM